MEEQRLIACFKRVFPQLGEDEIRAASIRGLGAWDSAALLQLIATVEKTFDVRFSPQHLETFTSFSDIRILLGRLAGKDSGCAR